MGRIRVTQYSIERISKKYGRICEVCGKPFKVGQDLIYSNGIIQHADCFEGKHFDIPDEILEPEDWALIDGIPTDFATIFSTISSMCKTQA